MISKILLFAALLCVGYVVASLAKLIQEKRRHAFLKRVRDRLENVYLVGCHPVTGERPDVGQMEEFCFFVEHGEMEEAVKQWEADLTESGNPLWQNEEVRPAFRIKIKCWLFQDGEFVNESLGEYGERVEWDVKGDRSKRHGQMSQMKRGWYKFAHHGLNVVGWSNE